MGVVGDGFIVSKVVMLMNDYFPQEKVTQNLYIELVSIIPMQTLTVF
jgi:hypothetical protein